MDTLVELPKIISDEEKSAYEQVCRKSGMDLATKIHNGAGMCSNIYSSLF